MLKDLTFCFVFIFFIILSIILTGVSFTPDIDLESDLVYSRPNTPRTSVDDKVYVISHISDLHISHKDPEMDEHFRAVLKIIGGEINPDIVVVSGDITDAKAGDAIYEIHQIEEEWDMYRNGLDEVLAPLISPRTLSSVILDMPGNHDRAGVPYDNYQASDLFYQYSPIKDLYKERNNETVPRSIVSIRDTSFGKYAFVIVDFAPYPKPSSPLGYISDDRFAKRILNELEVSLKEVMEADVNHIFLVSHYTVRTLISLNNPRSDSGKSFRDLVGEYPISVYLCGHEHYADDYIYTMGSKSTGMLQLELADLEYQKYFRTMIVDNDLISFDDVTLDAEYTLIMTNPKDSRYMTVYEPLERQLEDDIRVFLYAVQGTDDYRDKEITVSIDKVVLGTMTKPTGVYPVYTYKWNPDDYNDDEIHHIRFEFTCEGKQCYREYTFNLKGRRENIGNNMIQIFARANLSHSLNWILAGLFFYGFFLYTLIPKMLLWFQDRIKHPWLVAVVNSRFVSPLVRTNELLPDFVWYFVAFSFISAYILPLEIGRFVDTLFGFNFFFFSFGNGFYTNAFKLNGFIVVFPHAFTFLPSLLVIHISLIRYSPYFDRVWKRVIAFYILLMLTIISGSAVIPYLVSDGYENMLLSIPLFWNTLVYLVLDYVWLFRLLPTIAQMDENIKYFKLVEFQEDRVEDEEE